MNASKIETYSDLRKSLIKRSLFSPKNDIAEAINELGFLQADPIRCPARAQDLILRHRVKDYKAGDLEKYYPELPLEEAYLFAYGFMPDRDWNLIYPTRSMSIKKHEQKVLEFIKENKDVDSKALQNEFGTKKVRNPWGGTSQQAKQILEHLHAHGHLRVSSRRKGIRRYSVANQKRETLTKEERYKRILLKLIKVMGPTTPSFLFSETTHFNYLYQSNDVRRKWLNQLIEEKHLIQFEIENTPFVDSNQITESKLQPPKKGLYILAPFDPIVRDRQRFELLWNWSYRFEAYTPKAKRKLGYYALPLLWKDDVIGWINASCRDQKLHVEIGFAKGIKQTQSFQNELNEELSDFAEFLHVSADNWELTYLD